jgi:hypothetical protein
MRDCKIIRNGHFEVKKTLILRNDRMAEMDLRAPDFLGKTDLNRSGVHMALEKIRKSLDFVR